MEDIYSLVIAGIIGAENAVIYEIYCFDPQ